MIVMTQAMMMVIKTIGNIIHHQQRKVKRTVGEGQDRVHLVTNVVPLPHQEEEIVSHPKVKEVEVEAEKKRRRERVNTEQPWMK